MPKSKYRPNDLLSEIDRDKTTLLRWEKRGLIPKARRDSRGWRWYTPEEYHEVLNKVRQTKYFGNVSPAIVALLALGMGALSLLGFSRFAWGNTNLNMNINITAGTLSVTASSTVETFTSTAYSFTAATSASANVESVNIQDARGGAGSWTFNVSCNDSGRNCEWFGPTSRDRFHLNKDVSPVDVPTTSGIMCLDLSGLTCLSVGGDTCTDVTLTSGAPCFKAATDITAATGASANGNYYLKEWDWNQGIPAITSAAVYTTTITYDLQ